MSCGAENEANTILTTLLQGEDVTLPDIDYNGDQFNIPAEILAGLKASLSKLTNADLTTEAIDGTGTFDIMMRAMKAHLHEEYSKNRITGQEYTKVYIAGVETAMGQGIQFLLQRDLVFWQAQQAQLAALTARLAFETAKMQLATAKFEALNAKSTYGLTKMKISSESMAYCSAKYQLENTFPQQLLLLKEQTEAQRAQTLNTRSDGAAIAGLLGKQKDLYTQQITSYQRDAEVKAAKIFSDAWIVMKGIDEGLTPPDNFNNASLNSILADIKTNNNIG